jgi:hypothetical protein
LHVPVPVSWCRVGGADTYQRLSNAIPRERLDQLAARGVKARRDFISESALSLLQRTQTATLVNDKYEKVMSSGSQKISRWQTEPHDESVIDCALIDTF